MFTLGLTQGVVTSSAPAVPMPLTRNARWVMRGGGYTTPGDGESTKMTNDKLYQNAVDQRSLRRNVNQPLTTVWLAFPDNGFHRRSTISS